MLTKLGKYEIESELGTGAMGIVYKARDTRLGRPVALKTMSANVAGNPDLLKRFYREAQSAGQLRHPNIVTIYDIDEDQGIPFIAMEFLEGESLEDIIGSRKDVPVVRKLDIIAQACRGLHHAHLSGVVHRDVKPGNVMVLTDGLVKIVDFGIARIGGTSMTQTGMVLGTVMYMSPEQVRAQAIDARSDIFSVGIMLYELLAYTHPFPGGDVPAILFKILNEPPDPIQNHLPNCPPRLEKILLRALEKDREQRYQTAEDMAFDLQGVSEFLKRDMLDVYLQEGQRSLQEGNLTIAKESLQKVLEVDSSHGLAKNLLQQVQEQIYARQRGEKVEQALRQAKEALQADQYDEAIHWLDEVLRLDAEHAEAQQYKQMAVERRDRRQKIARHLEQAEKLATEADYKGAKAELEALLKVDREHSAALRMMDWVLKELTEQERLRLVRQHTQAARSHLAEKNFAQALEMLEKARELDPINIEVESLSRLVRSGQEKEERRQLLEQRLAAIQEAFDREEYEEAVTLGEKALQEFPEDPHVLKLHAQAVRRADIRRKRRSVDEQLTAAQDYFKKNQFSSARAVLEKALETFPDDSRLVSFLSTVREAEERATQEQVRRQAVQEANEKIRSKNFAAAIEVLERALARAGQSTDLSELLQFAREQQSEQQRQERIRQLLSQSQACLREQNFDEAIHILERGQQEFGGKEIEGPLAAAREQQRKFEKRREDTLAQAKQLLAAGEAVKAVALLEAAPEIYFKNDAFQRLYAQCKEKLDRANFIKTAVTQIEKCIAGEDWIQAEAVLHHALGTYPDDPALQAVQKRVQEEQAHVREVQWRRLLDEAKVVMGRMQYEEAAQMLASVPWDSAEMPALAEEAKKLLAEAMRRAEAAGKKPTLPPPVAPRRRPPTAAGIPVPVPVPAPQPRRVPVALWAGVAVLVAALAGFGVWRWTQGGPAVPGYVQLTSVPWAEVTGVQSASGEKLNITGQTPLQLALPAGKYVVDLKSGGNTDRVEVEVEAGQVHQVKHTFGQVKVDALVDEVVSQY